jgi:hypothetical protein
VAENKFINAFTKFFSRRDFSSQAWLQDWLKGKTIDAYANS